MTDFKAEIKKIVDEHESSFITREKFATSEKERLEAKRDFWLMSVYLGADDDSEHSFEEDDIEELKKNIANKLALSSLQRIGQNDWWETPANPWVESTLKDVQRTLERATKKKTGDRLRNFRWMWWILVELTYLAIVLGLFSAATSKFETVAVAALVLIYNKLEGVSAAIVLSFAYLAHTAEVMYWEFGRTLRLKVPISRLTEAKEVLSNLPIQNLIHNISIGIGSLIALWHLVMALLG